MTFERFPETRKIRTVSLDTNVLSDAVYYYILENKAKLGKKEDSYMERITDSVESIMFILSVDLRPIGIELVRKELKKKPMFESLYERVFGEQIKVSRDIKWLAQSYTKHTRLRNPDALILASASCGKVDHLNQRGHDGLNQL